MAQNAVRAVVRKGKIELLGKIKIPDGTKLIVTPVSDDDDEFWQKASESSLREVWDNPEDDVYAELLKK
jgi:hypothetical protein